MTKFLQGFIVSIAIIGVVGCSSLLNNNDGVFGKSQAAVQKVDTKVQTINDQESVEKDKKLTEIGAFAKGGVEYALDKIPSTNVTREISTAKAMNLRVEELANQPNFSDVKSIETIVDELTSQIETVRKQGEDALSLKDKQVETLQDQYKQLEDKREKEVSLALNQANEIAKTADQYKATLGQMDSFFGLGAIWYGAHKFIITSMWVLGIGLVLFIILRLLAGSNPIASAIFGIFEQAISCVINFIGWIFPKALSLAGQVSSEVYNGTKSALTSLIDSVETVKLQGDAAGTTPTIEDLLNAAEVNMTPADKAMIEKIKLELGWIKPTTAPSVVPLISSSTSSSLQTTSSSQSASLSTTTINNISSSLSLSSSINTEVSHSAHIINYVSGSISGSK